MANTKRATPKRATGGKVAAKTKSPSAKASAAKGKGKASASNASSVTTMTIAKGGRKRKRSNSITSDDEEECDADDENNQDSQDNQDQNNSDDQDNSDQEEDVEDNDFRAVVRFGTFGEEFFGFEDEYDDEDKSHIPPNSEQRRRNGRQAGRDLIIWNRPYMDAKLLLIMHYECTRHNIDVPWDAIAHRLHPGSSGSAVTQHLGRLRNTVFINGHLVPPDLPKSSGSRDPSHHTMRGLYRMEQNVRWSDEDPLFAAKRAITFKDKYEHGALNYGDVHCLPFDADTALDDGIMVDANNRILRQNNKKVPKSKAKAGTPSPRKRLTAKDTSSAAAFSTPRKPTSKKTPSAKKPVPAPDPVDLPSEEEYDPSAKATTTRRRSSRAKRIKTYHEADPEEEDESSEVLEVQEASVTGVSHNVEVDDGTSSIPDQTNNEAAANVVEQTVTDQEQKRVTASSSHSELSSTHDILGIYSANDVKYIEETQVISSDDGSSSYDRSSNCDPTSFGEMLSDEADFQINEQATLALDLAEAQKMTQEQQVGQMVHVGQHYYAPYAPHVNAQTNDAVNICPAKFQQFTRTRNIDGTASSTPSPPAIFHGQVAADNADIVNMHPAPTLVESPRPEGTLLQTFGAAHMANMAPMAPMGSGFTPPSSMFGGADASGYFGRAVTAAGQSNNHFPGDVFHGYNYFNAGHPNPQGM